MNVPKKIKQKISEYQFELTQDYVDKLKKNLELIKKFIKGEPCELHWVYPELTKLKSG